MQEAGFLGVQLTRFFFGGLPAVLNESLLGDCGFVHGQMEHVLFFLEFHRKCLDVHPFLPECGSEVARQSRALGNSTPKLAYLRHDLNLWKKTVAGDPVDALDHDISGRANFNPHRFQPSANVIRTTRAFSNRIPR